HFAPLGDKMVVLADGSDHQGVLLSDGTTAGTVELATFDELYATIDQPTAGDGVVYFLRFNYAQRIHELWKTDGTVAGTVRTDSLPMPPPNYGGARLKIAIGHRLFFATNANGGGTGLELWSADGTPG